MFDNLPYIGLFLSMVIQVIVPPLPAELIVIAAGRTYDPVLTIISAGAGLFTGSLIVYYLGRYIHKRFSLFFDRDKTRQVIARLTKIETLILWIRMLPYNPSDIISYAAGIVDVRPVKYVVITAFTSFIRVYLLTLLGTTLTSAKAVLQVAILLIISALVGSALLYGRNRGKKEVNKDIPPGPGGK